MDCPFCHATNTYALDSHGFTRCKPSLGPHHSLLYSELLVCSACLAQNVWFITGHFAAIVTFVAAREEVDRRKLWDVVDRLRIGKSVQWTRRLSDGLLDELLASAA